MKLIRRLPPLLTLPLVLVLGSACDIGAIFPPRRLVLIDVAGDTTVAVGDTIRLTATGTRDLIASTPDPLLDARWQSMDSRIASVVLLPRTAADSLASPALVRGVQPGRVMIQVSARGITATHVVNVR